MQLVDFEVSNYSLTIRNSGGFKLNGLNLPETRGKTTFWVKVKKKNKKKKTKERKKNRDLESF